MKENEIIKALENYSLKTQALFEAINLIKHQREEIDALRWTNKHLIKTEKEKRRELWKKAINQFMDELKTKWSYVPNLSIDGKEVIDTEDIEVVAKEMIDHIKE